MIVRTNSSVLCQPGSDRRETPTFCCPVVEAAFVDGSTSQDPVLNAKCRSHFRISCMVAMLAPNISPSLIRLSGPPCELSEGLRMRGGSSPDRGEREGVHVRACLVPDPAANRFHGCHFCSVSPFR